MSFDTAISRQVWDSKYRYRDGETIVDWNIEDSWRRVAQALAAAEERDRDQWASASTGPLKVSGSCRADASSFRPNPVTGAVLESEDNGEADVHCCGLRRRIEPD